jgi:GTP-binding protein Era
MFKSGFIAFIGRPNSGKSTLMNTVIGEQLSVVTPLPQTTRQNLKGIYTTDSFQLIFIDTPGIHKGKHVFNNSMIKEAKTAFAERGIDLLCYIVDMSRDFGEEERTVAKIVIESGIKTLLVYNKSDLCKKSKVKIEEFLKLFPEFANTPSITLSAIAQESQKVYLDTIVEYIPEGPRYYDPDDLTDASLRFFASEYVRKHVILNTTEEVPHATFVEVESYKETEGVHEISVTIHVETVGQRGIIVGKGGAIINKIKRGAQLDMQELVKTKVSFACHIKVSPRWRDNESFLRMMGLPISK